MYESKFLFKPWDLYDTDLPLKIKDTEYVVELLQRQFPSLGLVQSFED